MEQALKILVRPDDDTWDIPVSIEFRNGTHQTIEEGMVTYCDHADVEVEIACCSGAGSSGYIECGCGGQDSRYCDDCKRYVDEDGNWL